MTLHQKITPAQAKAVQSADAVLKSAMAYHTAKTQPLVDLRALSAIEEMYTYFGGDRA